MVGEDGRRKGRKGWANLQGQWLYSLKCLHCKICSFCPLDCESRFLSFVYSSVCIVAIKIFAIIRKTNPLWEAEAVIIPLTSCPYALPGVIKSNCLFLWISSNLFSISKDFLIFEKYAFSPACFTSGFFVCDKGVPAEHALTVEIDW